MFWRRWTEQAATRSFLVLLLAASIAACSGSDGAAPSAGTEAPTGYTYRIPSVNGDGWSTDHLADVGFDAALVVEMMERIADDTYSGIDGVAIARNETLVLARTFRTELDQFAELAGVVGVGGSM